MWAVTILALMHRPRFIEGRRLFSDDNFTTSTPIDLSTSDTGNYSWSVSYLPDNGADSSNTHDNCTSAEDCKPYRVCDVRGREGQIYPQSCISRFHELRSILTPKSCFKFTEANCNLKANVCSVYNFDTKQERTSPFCKQKCRVDSALCTGASYAQCSMRFSESRCPTTNACQIYTFAERDCFPGPNGKCCPSAAADNWDAVACKCSAGYYSVASNLRCVKNSL